MPEQTFRHCFDVLRSAEDLLESAATAAGSNQGQVAHRSVAGTLAVDDDRSTALEVGLAHQQLPAAGKLDDGVCLGRWR
jgi:hypothetical protein